MCTGGESNQGPLGPKSDALSTAPLRPSFTNVIFVVSHFPVVRVQCSTFTLKLSRISRFKSVKKSNLMNLTFFTKILISSAQYRLFLVETFSYERETV